MLEPGRDPDFAQEAIDADRACQGRMEHLDRDQAIVPPVACQPHRSHSAAAELALHAVAIAQRRLEAVEHEVRHRPEGCSLVGLPSR
ncbi:MAG TPA: hypothetical protein VJ794_10910 [Gemmatimonadales bacterium]|nr:hypothetical protein [Gemmatimonadales bacterium]